MTDLMLELRAADPARELEPTPAESARMDAGLRRARRPRRRWAALVPIAAAAAAAAIALPHHSASAATVLERLSARAAQAAQPQGRYAYLKQRVIGAGRDTTAEQWFADDGTAYNRTGSGPVSGPVRVPDVDGFTVAEVLALPTDPAALRAALAADDLKVVVGNLEPADADTRVTVIATALLGNAITPEPVKLALYQVLREQPDATVLGDVTDPQGRHGIGIQYGDAWKTTLVFDAASGELIATHSTGPGFEGWLLTLDSTRTDVLPR